MMPVRRDSFTILRETLRWRVALVLCVLVALLMLVLGTVNTRLGLADTALLAWMTLGVVVGCLTALLVLPRGPAGTLFYTVVAAILIVVVAYGVYHGRNMQHWAYIFPPVTIFLLRANRALAAMLAYGIYVTLATAQLLPAIDVVRFASGYGLLVCFMYTYALIEQRAAAMLRFHSERDALSNCFNRRTFNESLEQIKSTAASGSRCTFLLIDIDHFKAINDQHGHLVGDRIITQVAAALGRELDSGTPLFRYGGEEFAVMRVGGDERAGLELAQRLCETVGRTDFQGIRVTVSIGVAEWRNGPESVDAVLGHADRALYDAKRAGRNRASAGSMLGKAA